MLFPNFNTPLPERCIEAHLEGINSGTYCNSFFN